MNTAYSWIFLLWLSLSTGWRFWQWRIQLWLHTFQKAESIHTGMKQTLFIIRHGQSTWNIEQRLPGQLPGILLTDTGRQQVALLAEALNALPISAIISSPLERARDTAEIIAQSKGLTVQFEPELMDTNIGHWAGQSYKELAKTDPEWQAYVRNPAVAPEGVETFPQVQQRVIAAIERWRTQESIGKYPAFVAHADVVKLVIAHYSGLDAGRAGLLFIENASVSIIELGEEYQRVIAIGWCPKPGWLKPPVAEPAPTENSEQPKDSVQ